MKATLIYLLQASTLLAIWYVLYHLLLRKGTFFGKNRAWLLGGLGVALLLPFLPVELPALAEPVQNLNVFQWEGHEHEWSGWITETVSPTASFSWLPTLFWCWLGIATLLLLRFGFGIGKMLWLINQYPSKREGKFELISSQPPFLAASFFNRIMVSKRFFDPVSLEKVIEHEKTHAKYFHSIDQLLMGLMTAIFWFNPFIHLWKKRLLEVHEFQVDRHIMRQSPHDTAYRQLLARVALIQSPLGWTNGLKGSRILKRIQMIDNMKQHKTHSFRFFAALLLALAVSLSFAFIMVGQPMQAPVEAQVRPVSTPPISNPPSLYPLQDASVGTIKSSFGSRKNPFTNKMQLHTGVDIAAPTGTAIVATGSGTVREAGSKPATWGNYVIIDHDEVYSTMYAHMDGLEVETGAVLKKGDLIGTVGNTGRSLGSHLHYEVMKGGERVDPEGYFSR